MPEEARRLGTQIGALIEGQKHFGAAIVRIEKKQDEIHAIVAKSREEAATLTQAQADHVETDDRRFDSHGRRIDRLERGAPSRKQVLGAGTGLVGLGALAQWLAEFFRGQG